MKIKRVYFGHHYICNVLMVNAYITLNMTNEYMHLLQGTLF